MPSPFDYSSLDAHYSRVIKGIAEGRVIPLLGAGANLCDRPVDAKYEPGRVLPSGAELASQLADESGYPPEGRVVECPHCHEPYSVMYPLDLLKVSQHIATTTGSGPLYQELRNVFNLDYQPSSLHSLLAELPGLMRASLKTIPYQLIITTNYDNVLETAFDDAKEPYDLVSYIADGEDRGKFSHKSPDGVIEIVETANNYDKVTTETRTVIMKIHGAVDRTTPDNDSYVITEDHYIDFLAHADVSNVIPIMLNMKMRRSHFLFLGYSLRDWNLRVILHRIWGERKLSYKSWAIQKNPEPLDVEFWSRRDVQILDCPLEKYVQGLRERLPRLL